MLNMKCMSSENEHFGPNGYLSSLVYINVDRCMLAFDACYK